MCIALYFLNMALNFATDISQRIRQYTAEYIDAIMPSLTNAFFHPLCRRRKIYFLHTGPNGYRLSVGSLFYDFFGGNTLK
ncbi:hypothetical protein [Sodalis-like endosymbiont of Proechinophthirus fluctus]|uniref:hypothetical protein n=1 Tax=Sodalis-like endosymbiont of Proechinophthirus fluctus TaxID=1462730 RepID=UPI000A3E7519|nr:hypothetical protein [Sodalis-like endosymbiont of Proechinophthirus fluctus]